MKYFSLLICLFSLSAMADSVRIYDANNLTSVPGILGGISVSLYADSPSGDATAETAPGRVYIPVVNANNNLNYSTLKVSTGITTLYDITSLSHIVGFPLSLTVGGTAKYIYLAVRGGASGTSYYVSARSTTTYSNLSSSHIDFSVTPFDICKSVILNNISTVCNTSGGALSPSSTTNVVYKPMLYFFVSDQDMAFDGSTAIDPANASYSGGVYFEAQMSNRVYDTIVVSINQLRKGDKRLLGTYESSSTIDTSLMKKVFAYSYTDTSTPILTNVEIGAASAGSILANDLGSAQDGEFIINNLNNGDTYKLSLGLEDKFHFTTKLSLSASGTPTEIEELLKKQSCYILTAGFGEEHYVTNYFRDYRDQVLANSWVGRKLIRVYYSTAPHYAMFIYRHDSLRATIRGLAYLVYFNFKYGLWILLGYFSCYCLNILRKNKIFLKQNRL